MLENHPITQEIISKKEAEISAARSNAAKKRKELMKNLGATTVEHNAIIAQKKVEWEKALAMAKTAQDAIAGAQAEKIKALNPIESELREIDCFLRETANSEEIEGFRTGLRYVLEFCRKKGTKVMEVYRETNTLTDVITEFVTSQSDHAKEVIMYVTEALRKIDDLYLVPIDEARAIIKDIANGLPAEINAALGTVELKSETTSRVIGKPEITKTYKSNSARLPSWL